MICTVPESFDHSGAGEKKRNKKIIIKFGSHLHLLCKRPPVLNEKKKEVRNKNDSGTVTGQNRSKGLVEPSR